MVPNCKSKEKCSFSHTESEIKYHPLTYPKEYLSISRNENNGPENSSHATFINGVSLSNLNYD
jgi:hypothetical protein